MAKEITGSYLGASRRLIELQFVLPRHTPPQPSIVCLVDFFIRGEEDHMVGGDGEVAVHQVAAMGGIEAAQGRVDDGG